MKPVSKRDKWKRESSTKRTTKDHGRPEKRVRTIQKEKIRR